MEPNDELRQPVLFLREVEQKAQNTDFLVYLEAVLSNSSGIINKLEHKLRTNTGGFHNKFLQLPYYNILLAYAYYAKDQMDTAIVYAERSETAFRNEEARHIQEAVCSWFSGLLYCKHGMKPEADKKIKDIKKKIAKWEMDIHKDDPENNKYLSLKEAIGKNYEEVATRYENVPTPIRIRNIDPAKVQSKDRSSAINITYAIDSKAVDAMKQIPFSCPFVEKISKS